MPRSRVNYSVKFRVKDKVGLDLVLDAARPFLNRHFDDWTCIADWSHGVSVDPRCEVVAHSPWMSSRRAHEVAELARGAGATDVWVVGDDRRRPVRRKRAPMVTAPGNKRLGKSWRKRKTTNTKPRRSKKWIQAARIKRGALHRRLGIPQGKKIPVKLLREAAKASGRLGRQARLALTLRAVR